MAKVAKQVQQHNSKSIAGRFPMPDVEMQPMPRAASTYSDSAYAPVVPPAFTEAYGRRANPRSL